MPQAPVEPVESVNALCGTEILENLVLHLDPMRSAHVIASCTRVRSSAQPRGDHAALCSAPALALAGDDAKAGEHQDERRKNLQHRRGLEAVEAQQDRTDNRGIRQDPAGSSLVAG